MSRQAQECGPGKILSPEERSKGLCSWLWLFAGGNQSLTWYPYLGRLLVEPRCTLGTLLIFGLSPLPPDTSDYFRGRGTGCRRNISSVVVVLGALWKPGGLSWPASMFSEVIVLLQVLSGKSSCLDPLAWIKRCFPGHRNHLRCGTGAVSGSFSRESRRSEDPPWNNSGYNNKALTCVSSLISSDQNWFSNIFSLCSQQFFCGQIRLLFLSLCMNGLCLELASKLESLLHPDTQHWTCPECPEAVHDRAHT